MVITLNLPDTLAQQLQAKARLQQQNIVEIIVKLLTLSFEAPPAQSLADLIAEIKATPPNPLCVRPAQGRLAEVLESAPLAPDFDLELWTQQWALVEAEMKATTQANALAERIE